MNDLNQDKTPVEPHIFRMFAIYGLTYCVIYADNTSSDASEGFMHHTIELVKGEGVYESSPNVIHNDERLFDIGIFDAYPCRNDPTRYLLLLTNENLTKYTHKKMTEDLELVKKVTEELNDSIDLKLRDVHKYDITLPVRNMAFGNNTIVSLDQFLDDEHVIEVMEKSNWVLGPHFARCGAAAMYFNPGRETYPVEARKYGFVSLDSVRQ